MDKNAISFSGYPTTRARKDRDGKVEYHVYPKALTPLGKKIVDRTSLYVGVSTLAISAVYVAIQVINEVMPIPALLAIPVAGAAAWGFTKWQVGELLSTGRQVIFTETEIKIQKWVFFWVRYDRKHPHAFSYREHPKAKIEQDKSELQQKKAIAGGKKYSPKKLYSKHAQILEFEYFGEASQIMAFYDEEKAKAVQARLQTIDFIASIEGNSLGAASLSPSNDWTNQAGDLDDEL